ncbi:hypothetical protein PAMA_009423 [Pampus argenteus]
MMSLKSLALLSVRCDGILLLAPVQADVYEEGWSSGDLTGQRDAATSPVLTGWSYPRASGTVAAVEKIIVRAVLGAYDKLEFFNSQWLRIRESQYAANDLVLPVQVWHSGFGCKTLTESLRATDLLEKL